ncbi:MAG: PAS domain-containing protein [Ardenticatenaceae bacterium]|nr:PAS domain-containing protein [Ardenticatenaceae bacterium]
MLHRLFDPFSRTGDGVWAVDTNYQVVFWNESAARMLEISAREALGQTCYELFEGRTLDNRPLCGHNCPIMQQVRTRQPVPAFDLDVRVGGGKCARINVSIVPDGSTDETGEPELLVFHVFRGCAHSRSEPVSPPSPPGLRIHLLGTLQVLRPDGSTVDGGYWRRQKVGALLAVLAINRGQKLHRDQILDALWPEMEYEAGLRNFNTTVYYLRRCLEPELARGADSHYIRHEGSYYVLANYDEHWIDAVAFEERIHLARCATNSKEAIEHYQTALGWYEGKLLSSFLYEDLPWCTLERDRLHEVYLNALEDLASALEGNGRDDEALDTYLQLAGLDPCRESSRRRLIRLYLRRQDRAAALKQYAHLARALEEDLAVSPSPLTQQLYEVALGNIPDHHESVLLS